MYRHPWYYYFFIPLLLLWLLLYYLSYYETNKRSYYHFLQEAQLPQRNSASAAHMEGAKPPVHSPSPFGYTYAYGRIRNPQQTYVKSVKLNRAFKVIQGYPYLCPCPINTAVIPETYEDMATGTQRIRRFQRPHSSLKTSQQETPSNIYKLFMLPETTVIGLHFCCWWCGSTFISFHVIMPQIRILWI